MTVVGDTSVLRYLVTLGQVDLLPRRFGQLLIPPEVADECRPAGSPEALRTFIRNPPGWLSIDRLSAASTASTPGLERLDPGEAAAIRLALARNAKLLLIDERLGRRVATNVKLRVSGTLGIIADAAQRGWLDFEMTVQDLIEKTNFRVSHEVIEAVRRRLDTCQVSEPARQAR